MKAIVLAIVCCIFATTAHARGLFGLQAGGSFGPDQFVAGIHMGFDAGKLKFVPSADLGVTGDAFTIAANADGHYALNPGTRLDPYVGAGLTLYNVDPDGDAGSSTEFGGALIGGIHATRKLFLEGKVGLGDVPDFKLMAGFTP